MNGVTTKITDGIAGAALVSPWWLPFLQNASDIAGLLLPIAGLIWLVIQIVGYIIKDRKSK